MRRPHLGRRTAPRTPAQAQPHGLHFLFGSVATQDRQSLQSKAALLGGRARHRLPVTAGLPANQNGARPRKAIQVSEAEGTWAAQGLGGLASLSVSAKTHPPPLTQDPKFPPRGHVQGSTTDRRTFLLPPPSGSSHLKSALRKAAKAVRGSG